MNLLRILSVKSVRICAISGMFHRFARGAARTRAEKPVSCSGGAGGTHKLSLFMQAVSLFRFCDPRSVFHLSATSVGSHGQQAISVSLRFFQQREACLKIQ